MKHLFVILILLCELIARGQSNQQQFSGLMKRYHAFNMFDGAVLVARNGKVVYKEAFGLANREWNISNTTDTKFMIGSISKPLTAMLVLRQVEKGRIDLDGELSSYLPEFAGKPAAKVTIRQLLNHTSGMPNYDITKDFFPRISRQYFERKDYLEQYIDSSLAFEPGTKYNYSSWGYFTLGYLLEKLSGKPYASLMREEVFLPAGMKNSGSYYHTQVVPKRATGYDYDLGNYTSADFRDQSNTMGTGDIYSTVEDLFLFHMAISEHKLLGRTLTTEMFRPGIKPADYGFGWFNKQFRYTDKDSVAANFHLGMTEGFISFFLRIPSTNSLVVILCNSSPTDFFGITRNLVATMYGKNFTLKEPVHKRIEQVLGSKGAAAAVQEFEKISKDTNRFYVEWISMNFIAEHLLAKKRIEEALIIAESNARAFPNRDLVMVTMGNVYLKLGRLKESKTFFERALAIYPGYEEARNRLKEIETKLND